MPIYEFEDILEIENRCSLHHKSLSSGKVSVSIVFEYYFEEDYESWHLNNDGNLRVLEVMDSKSGFIDTDSLEIEEQIHIRRLCNQYLDTNKLRLYSNIIPLYAYPVGIRKHKQQNGCTNAEILPFEANPS